MRIQALRFLGDRGDGFRNFANPNCIRSRIHFAGFIRFRFAPAHPLPWLVCTNSAPSRTEDHVNLLKANAERWLSGLKHRFANSTCPVRAHRFSRILLALARSHLRRDTTFAAQSPARVQQCSQARRSAWSLLCQDCVQVADSLVAANSRSEVPRPGHRSKVEKTSESNHRVTFTLYSGLANESF